ncbi:hypothetical protein CNECB9_1940023 [Cupriavidus necator]|uniref:Bacterial toxin 22 domain-containing protein n=1 Tax=Cupriavidus necator TaxID=106590 RepID=A0A1K0IBX0_CUPNE|nr:hypothetical protein CNECB9_1940023 [Cupriavidus necator]
MGTVVYNRMGSQGRGLLPDYAAVTATVLSANTGGALNLYDGTAYASGSVTRVIPAPTWSPGASATFGWIFGANDASAANSFMNGSGNQIGVSVPTPFRFNIVGGITHAYGGATAIELGIGPPGPISGGITPWSYSTPVVGGKN